LVFTGTVCHKGTHLERGGATADCWANSLQRLPPARPQRDIPRATPAMGIRPPSGWPASLLIQTTTTMPGFSWTSAHPGHCSASSGRAPSSLPIRHGHRRTIRSRSPLTGSVAETVVTRSNSAPVVNGNEPLNAQARFLRIAHSKVGDGTGWSLSFWSLGRMGPPPRRHHRLLGDSPQRFATSSAAAGYPASYAGDGIRPHRGWPASLLIQNNNNNAWIQLDFGASRALQSVKLAGAPSSLPYPAWSPTNYSIQIST